jgi:hypothetical protein
MLKTPVKMAWETPTARADMLDVEEAAACLFFFFLMGGIDIFRIMFSFYVYFIC